ncbi:hypothetical protein [Kitasatospora sp. NPDC005856]|uniref:hypothetical protein n=1 Tax=Kitasatospora sp. NPDC005856 TaxID=3154566 RepID=UPI0033C61B31
MLLLYSTIDPLFPPGRCVYAQVVIRDPDGDVLQTTTNAADNCSWDIPTWRALRDQEPHEAARIAARRDVTLEILAPALLVVDTTPASNVSAEAYWFVFDGGTLTAQQLTDLSLPTRKQQEHDNLRFADPDHIPSERTRAALRHLADPSAPVLLTSGHPAG